MPLHAFLDLSRNIKARLVFIWLEYQPIIHYAMGQQLTL